MFQIKNSKNQAVNNPFDARSRKQVAYLFAHTSLLRIAIEFLSENRIVIANDSHRFNPNLSVLQELSQEKLSQILVMKSDLYESIDEEEYASIIDSGLSDEALSRSLKLYEDENYGFSNLTKEMSNSVFLDYIWLLESPQNNNSESSGLGAMTWLSMCENA